MASFTRSIDLSLKTFLFTKFADILGIDKSGAEADNINQGIVQCPKEIALRELAEKRGEIFLTFGNFWRTRTSPSWERQRTPVARRGLYSNVSDSSKTSTVHIKAMPIDLEYSVWFWSKDLDKIYQCIEEYIFWQQNNPNLILNYDDQYALELDLHFGEIIDQSTIDEKYTQGILYVYKFPITVDAWIFESVDYKTIKKIMLTCYDKDNVASYSEIVVEDSNQDTELEAALKMFRRDLYGVLDYDLDLNAIVVSGNFAADFSVGDKIFVENSTSSNGIYTVASASFADSCTKVVVTETLVDSAIKGNIYKNEDD